MAVASVPKAELPYVLFHFLVTGRNLSWRHGCVTPLYFYHFMASYANSHIETFKMIRDTHGQASCYSGKVGAPGCIVELKRVYLRDLNHVTKSKQLRNSTLKINKIVAVVDVTSYIRPTNSRSYKICLL